MPRKNELSWEGAPRHRWSVMLDDTRYRVTCRQLGLPRDQWTFEASYQAANAWWTKKQLELATARANLHPHAPELKQFGARLDYAKRHGLTDDAEIIDAEIIRVRDADPHEGPGFSAATLKGIELAELVGIPVPPDLDPIIAEAEFGDGKVWSERLARDKQTPPERTIGALADRWLGDRQHEARAGVRSNESADALKRAVGKFGDYAGRSSPVESITAELWERWFVRCAGMVVKRDADPSAGWSAETAAKFFGVARSFVLWLWEREHLPALPRNFASKKHKFERPHKDIPTFTGDDIKLLIGAARGVHRLILLLMLNCGMTQKDVADLRKDQVTPDGGRIIRRRSKMARNKSARLVNYKLWPEVAALLATHTNTNKDEPRALVTKSGKPWVWSETTADGKMKKSDNVATVFNTIKRKVGMNPKGPGKRTKGKSLKVFRKTSATLLKGNREHSDLRFWFLGHSEKTVADQRYAANTQPQLDAAVAWLGEQYGLI